MASDSPRRATAKGTTTASRKTRARPGRRTKTARLLWQRAARPDAIDPRDRWYTPGVGVVPQSVFFPAEGLAVKNQGQTNACTGFGLSLVVEQLLRRAGREALPSISPFMLYSMARRYDEFAGAVADGGSSLRGALKGWFKHGACTFPLFPQLEMPPPASKVEHDWWFDAVRRPLGAYYRLKTSQITDMHAALNEAGVLYASCGCHAGWDEGIELETMAERPTSFELVWTIPVQPGPAAHEGHAFALVGYNERGFLVQNSWGIEWGSHGYALLTYDDWLKNAMDCWVAQLGVVTQDHLALAHSASLRQDGKTGRVALAQNEVLRNREIGPYVVDMGNNGALSTSGDFRTTPDDVHALAGTLLERARAGWGLERGTVDVCVFAHGGLVDERAAARIAATWVPKLYESCVFPVFLMWETGFLDALARLLDAALEGVPRAAAGTAETAERWWNQRLERALARPGTLLWREMKRNAEAMSLYREGVADDQQAGAVLLYSSFMRQVQNKDVRLHFVGHSAGAIAGATMVQRLVEAGLPFDSVTFMAPALRLDAFEQQLLPLLQHGGIRRYQQFSLTEGAEEDDASCGAYRRSLLHLVSEALEGGVRTPILGLARDVRTAAARWPRTTLHLSPGPRSTASTHGAFDADGPTIRQVLKFIVDGR